MTRRLQVLLYFIAAYLLAAGGLFVIAPGVAERITETPRDPILSLLYGQYALTLAVVSFFAAREQQARSRLSLVVLVLIIGHVVVFGHLLLSGVEGFAQAGPPLIVNGLLTVLLFWFRNERRSQP